MVLPPRLRSVGYKLKTGHFRDALQDLQPVYDPARDLDRLLMADIRFHTGQWEDAETLASDLTATQAVPAGIQGRAYELLTWLIKYKDGIPSALAFAEKSLQQAERANDLEQTAARSWRCWSRRRMPSVRTAWARCRRTRSATSCAPATRGCGPGCTSAWRKWKRAAAGSI
jgi:hypothetical protein